jgi:hypothetical protein
VLHADAPGVGPEFAKCLEKTSGRERDPVVANASKWIVSERLGGVGGIEIEQPATKPRWSIVHDLRCEVAVWIDEGEAA